MASSRPSPSALVALATPAARYTSYPSVPHWTGVEPGAFHRAVAGLEEPSALYVHVPFCWKQCWYCGCNMVVARRQAAGDRYLAAIRRQVEALPLRRDRAPITRIHLGGGTPTWLSPEQLGQLLTLLHDQFDVEPDAERSVEVHPGVTRPEHLDVLARAGVGRLSIGVQSTSSRVLQAIGRTQDQDSVRAVADGARERGIRRLNLDLVVGLPHQTAETLDRTLDMVEDLRPDRLAIYAYAHMPWLLGNQAQIDGDALPGPVERLELAALAGARLEAAGWRALGLDHYALPHDPLARAAAAGTLTRDFMGHTDRATPLIGLGPSAISEIGAVYAQQPSKLGQWYRAVEGEQPLPVHRGHLLSAEDRIRRAVIRRLMGQLVVDAVALQVLPDARERLGPWEARGALAASPDGLRVAPGWRPVLRNLAACFDTYVEHRPPTWRIAPDAARGVSR